MTLRKEAQVAISIDGISYAIQRNPTLASIGGVIREPMEDTDTPGVYSERIESARLTFNALRIGNIGPETFKSMSNVSISWISDIGRNYIMRAAVCLNATNVTDGTISVEFYAAFAEPVNG